MKTISVLVNGLVEECYAAISDNNLKHVQPFFERLYGEQAGREQVIAGLIRLGEALTFCRNKSDNNLGKTGIVDAAIKFARVRNYLVHRFVYGKFLKKREVEDFQKLLRGLPDIGQVEESLLQLKQSEINILSKPVRKGFNEFPFSFYDHLGILEEALDKLSALNLDAMGEENLSADPILRASLENQIRDLLNILADLASVESGYLRAMQAKQTEKYNKSFCKQHDALKPIFSKENRHALCHFDQTLIKPYSNFSQMLEFSRVLLQLKTLGYVRGLRGKTSSQQPASEAEPERKPLAPLSTRSTLFNSSIRVIVAGGTSKPQKLPNSALFSQNRQPYKQARSQNASSSVSALVNYSSSDEGSEGVSSTSCDEALQAAGSVSSTV